jgi:hypothetical protein
VEGLETEKLVEAFLGYDVSDPSSTVDSYALCRLARIASTVTGML